MDVIIVGTLIASACVYFGVLILAMWGSCRVLCKRLGVVVSTDSPEFDLKSAYATNLTAATSVLGILVSAKVLPAASPLSPQAHTRFLPSADSYTLLSLFFTA